MKIADLAASAFFSVCGRYRYVLRRNWDSELGTVLIIGLNPSTADATKDDPTIRQCIRFAKSWGYGKLIVANLFALRSTDPRAISSAVDPVGPLNDRAIAILQEEAQLVIAAWGVHGQLFGRAEKVLSLLKNPHHLGLTKDGSPRHPLYLKATTQPAPLLAHRREKPCKVCGYPIHPSEVVCGECSCEDDCAP